MFHGATTKFSIGSLDDVDLEVDAQFNPKELQFDRTFSWNVDGSTAGQDKNPVAEFSGANAESVKIDLLFDGVENNGRLDSSDSETVEQRIQTLRNLAMVMTPNSRKRDGRRPHVCVATWGASTNAMPRFECVIESMSVKYQVFANNGDVLRATVTLGLKGVGRSDRKDSGKRADREQARAAVRADADKRRDALESSNWGERGEKWRTFDRKIQNNDGTYGTWRNKTMNEE